MEDKILKQIENEVGRIINEAPFKMDESGRFYGYHTITNRLIEAAKFGYNIKESVDEKMSKNIEIVLPSATSACKYDIQVKSMVGEVLFEHTFYGDSIPILSASQNTVSNEGLPHLDEFMKVTAKDKPIRNRK